ncbi:MAG: YidC/Oxa1 family membrane protein insertase, partial [Lachnospiraceae bacterium]|nr:YidC/Oxa1 family membrane protein insertase [Lachnospiraceae bacterium]
MKYIQDFLYAIMNWCYGSCGNYGWAIVLFTFITRILLLPLSLWTYFNGITMIKIQPDVNFLKVKYYGQGDRIAEEQADLFKEKGYKPLVSVIPTIAQFFLLLGVVGVIKRGINDPAIDMGFYGINLGAIPSESGISLLWSPILAGLAAFILCIAQNKSSVLQAEQSKLNKYGMTIFSVGLSLYLGWFVAIGTAFYWVCSNLFAVLQLYISNWIVRPRRYVDYDRLEESRRQLAEIQNAGKKKGERYFSENRKRERKDYKRFFSVVNKHLVFYSESSGFYKYYKGIIEYLLNHSNLTIHYITSDPNDVIFTLAKSNPKIRPYYIGENKLITLMMKMDADV